MQDLIREKSEKHDGSSFYSAETRNKFTLEVNKEAQSIFKRIAATYNPKIIGPFAKSLEIVFH